ncbi:hypothetical protein KEM48_013226 [Puccinia striiformis f. sp. tritici PST-130]|nr:hypothetical protein KEM48_013226 [Puccinia striiformis f. sp. tritici PST-130]
MPPKRTTNAQKRALLLKGKGSSTTPKKTKSKKKAETVEEVLTTQSHLKREDYQIIINWLRNKKNFKRSLLPLSSFVCSSLPHGLFVRSLLSLCFIVHSL